MMIVTRDLVGIVQMTVFTVEHYLNMENDEKNDFVILSRRLRSEGDTAHAERLLKSGLKRVESSLQNYELAMLEILQELISIYSEQGRLDEHALLSKRLNQIADTDIFNRDCLETVEEDTTDGRG